jgi:exodeoxyribonuclease V beta subunit
MSNVIIIAKPEDIDLGRHGVIEAHAGTGKTYTIVEMVLRILEQTVTDEKHAERSVHIREVLLVTFTEKAAGDLRKRIREGLENRIRTFHKDSTETGTELRKHLEDCLNNIHESFIGTIHGVCLRLLQTWPFETGVHFKTEIADDSEGLAEALRASMRSDWQDPDNKIIWALERMQEQGMRLEEEHFTLVTKIAEQLLDKDNTVLDRRTCGNFRLTGLVQLFEKECRASLPEFMGSVERLQKFLDGFAPPDAFHENAKIAITSVKAWAEQIIAGTLPINVKTVASLSKYKKPDKNGVLRSTNICDAVFKKTRPGYELDCLLQTVQSHRCITSLCTIRNALCLTLLCDAAELLRDRWIRTKQEKGLISFQDMLRLMHNAVTDNPVFCAKLRQRLRFGIIDEFQDTSMLQWGIFNRIFLETPDENGPRLFIVGDPKQSIYSFQGADVQSYLDAKIAIEKKKGQVYGLINNYRSLPETIDGCNTIFKRDTDGEDWFAFDETAAGEEKISYPSEGEGGALAQAPAERTHKPNHRLQDKPVQIMDFTGNAAQRRPAMAARASTVIRSLKGKTISIPKGTGWADITLDYKDFAVIVESHTLAGFFLEQFQKGGIPAVKYKMEGVFQSPLALDLHALLRAIIRPTGEGAPRLAALLTRFFNRHPGTVDPEKDLEPCLNPFGNCGHGDACISHALEEWTYLTSRHLWSRLFRSILERTSIRERLVRLADGQRHLADLRQVSDYCLEKLYRGNLSLEQLVEHLGRLLAEEESAGRDKNLFMLSTDKSSVRVLTMHAAKGLEFPVVFVATLGSRNVRSGANALSWVGDDRKSHVVPYLKIEETRIPSAGQITPHDRILTQAMRERRRLLYVALTRAQAMLFVPAHLREFKMSGNGDLAGYELLDNKQRSDNDLTPRLLRLFNKPSADRMNIALFDHNRWNGGPAQATNETDDHLDPAWAIPSEARKASDGIAKQIQALNLHGRISWQTSYSELSREADSDRAIDHSDEGNEAPGDKFRQRPLLPGGAQTGDALHLALEEIVSAEDIKTVLCDRHSVNSIVEKYLDRNGVLNGLRHETERNKAIDAGVDYVNGALTTSLPLPEGGTVAIGDLARSACIPEMEFFLGVSPHWVHGFMDLVFRLENKNAKHPWHYFVLDWKSDQLDAFDPQNVKACIEERHYDLQSKIYCHALDTYLKGLLGETYDPGKNLGGAVYVFLRSFDARLHEGQCHVWTRSADPEEDSKFAKDQIHDLIIKKSGRA